MATIIKKNEFSRINLRFSTRSKFFKKGVTVRSTELDVIEEISDN